MSCPMRSKLPCVLSKIRRGVNQLRSRANGNGPVGVKFIVLSRSSRRRRLRERSPLHSVEIVTQQFNRGDAKSPDCKTNVGLARQRPEFAQIEQVPNAPSRMADQAGLSSGHAPVN
jgi:hypothetical protein